MKQDHEPTHFEQHAQDQLRNSIEHLDAATLSRLAAMRATALAQRPGSRWFDLRFLAPAGALAAGLAIAVLMAGRHDALPVNDSSADALYDLELLADADAYELTQEDPEFIEWAASMGEQGT